MLLWTLLALLTVLVVAALTRPMLRTERSLDRSRDADIAVYRDQLAAIKDDCDKGVLPKAEAEAARAEIGRRLLDSARREAGLANAPPASRLPPRWVAYAITASVPLLGVSLYLAAGSPHLPGQSRAARAALPIEQASIEEIVAKVEARLQETPDDGRGWDVIAPIYLLQQRYRDAADAFAKAILLLGETPKRLTGLAESSIRAGNGIVSNAARGAYEKLLLLEPGRADARFWIAVAKEQDGDLAGAADGYREVLAKADTEAPWRKPSEERLKAIEEGLGSPPSDGVADEPKPVD